MTTLSIDAMGGDDGAEVTVPAAIKFLSQPDSANQKIILVGDEATLEALIHQHKGDYFVKNGRLSIRTASQVVEMNESPVRALKKKKDSSMRVAINLVKDGEADACVSAGNTGALMATAKFVLKTIPGIKRPAICSSMPCPDPNSTVYMLDLGANVDSSPEMLLEFAVMGSVLTEYVEQKQSPTIGLLNVGAEEIKGSEKVKQASILLSDSELNYVGYIEGDEIFTGKVNVIVCDGFEGNVALKASEGTASMILGILKTEYKRNWFRKLTALASKPVFKAMQVKLDPRNFNGATLIGLNGIVVKSHGGTDSKGFLTAIREAAKQADMDVITHISEEINKMVN